MSMSYNNPAGGTDSTVGSQQYTHFYDRQALIEVQKDRVFSQLASTREMPRHYGKKISINHYLPILDDANINDQGIDALGATTTRQVTIEIVPAGVKEASSGKTNYYAVGFGNSDANALTAAKAKAVAIFKALNVFTTDYNASVSALQSAGWSIQEKPAVAAGGNLYGSSKDIGYITGKLPTLSENGGRVNRVGVTRRTIESNLEKYGFFDEYTKESLDFDSDKQLEMHVRREMVRAATEISEDLVQMDLINNAGVVRYGGTATSISTLTGEQGATASLPTYMGLLKMSISLDNNHCPKSTTIISGSRMTDTKTINAARYMYVGSELIPVLEAMKDAHNERAFISVEKYAQAGMVANGEEGSVGRFRVIVAREMMKKAGAGATVTTNDGYYETDGKYDAFPMLVVGSGSFTTVGFESNGVQSKFKIKHVKPESDIAYSKDDPFGEKGFMSIKWYYGFMPLRPEWIALYWVVAPY